MPRQTHRHCFRYSTSHHISDRRPTQVVKKQTLPLRFLVFACHELAQPRSFAERIPRSAKVPDRLIVGSGEDVVTRFFCYTRTHAAGRRLRRSFLQFATHCSSSSPSTTVLLGQLAVPACRRFRQVSQKHSHIRRTVSISSFSVSHFTFD
jgi:hypothetical protein